MTAIVPERPAGPKGYVKAPGLLSLTLAEEAVLAPAGWPGPECPEPADAVTAVRARALLGLALTAYGMTIQFDQGDPAYAEYLKLLPVTGLEPT